MEFTEEHQRPELTRRDGAGPAQCVSLVVNIFDLINFSIKLVSKAKEVHKSAAGADKETVDIETTTKDLEDLTAKLQSATNGGATCDPALENLYQGCKEVTGQLLDALIKVKVDGKKGKWKSTRKALRSV